MTGPGDAPRPADVDTAIRWFRENPEGLEWWESGSEATTPEERHAATIVRAALAAGPDEALADAYETARSAVLHGVVAPKGASHLAGEVSEDEALEHAAALIEAVEARGGVATLAGARPAAEPAAEPGTILHAWQQITRLVGREDTSPASVVDRVAYLAESAARPAGDATTEVGTFQRGWREGATWQRHRIRDLIEAAKTSDYFQQQLDELLADDPGEGQQ